MTLLEEIASWDGKSATALQSTYERHSDEEDFLATILEHIADVELQRAATWLLKRHLEAGNSLSPGDSRAILGVLSDQEHWESRLHLLQCLPYLDIPRTRALVLSSFWTPVSKATTSSSGRGPITDSTNCRFASRDTGKR